MGIQVLNYCQAQNLIFLGERLQVGQYQGFYMAIQMDIYKILYGKFFIFFN